MNFDPAYAYLQIASPKIRLRQLIQRGVLSNRFAILGAFVLGIVIPELFHPLVKQKLPWLTLAHAADPMIYATAIALLLAHLALRRTSPLPFVDTKVIILPIFITSFAAIMIAAGVIFQTLGYYHLTTGFVAGLGWYTLLIILRARLGKRVVVLVGVSDIEMVLQNARVIWLPWTTPRLPRGADAIVYDSNQEYSPKWERFFSRAVLRNIPVYDLDHIREMLTGRVRLRSKPELVFGQLLPSQPYLRLKRVIDFVLALVLLVPILMVMAVAALAIRMESSGSVLFRQTRVGYQGRLFTCYKLRTMRSGQAGPLYTREADPRITRIGKFLRKSRIDELPQIFNVLKGEMSWIGPRPEALRLSRGYEASIPYYRYRHSVRPGISGWAAVHQGNVAQTDAVTRKLEYDFYYIKHFSIWLDFVIILMTIRTIITGSGSR